MFCFKCLSTGHLWGLWHLFYDYSIVYWRLFQLFQHTRFCKVRILVFIWWKYFYKLFFGIFEMFCWFDYFGNAPFLLSVYSKVSLNLKNIVNIFRCKICYLCYFFYCVPSNQLSQVSGSCFCGKLTGAYFQIPF